MEKTIIPNKKRNTMILSKIKRTVPSVLMLTLIGSCSILFGAEVKIGFPAPGTKEGKVFLSLHDRDPLTTQSFGALISQKMGKPYTIALLKGPKSAATGEYTYTLFDDEALTKAMGGVMKNPLPICTLKAEDITRYKIADLSVAPERVGLPTRPAVAAASAEGIRRATEVSTSTLINFPSITRPLMLGELESFSQKTFAALIKESFLANKSYKVAIIPSKGSYYFFDAPALEGFISRLGHINPISREVFSPHDVEVFEITDIKTTPKRISP
jgi:hypothetical protein